VLADANIDRIKVRDTAQRLKLYTRQAKDRGMIADAAELQLDGRRSMRRAILKRSRSPSVGVPFSQTDMRENLARSFASETHPKVP
jgi:hypothetical protein